LIKVGRASVVKSLHGILTTSYNFLLAELRRRYPGDWDRAVDRREAKFRNELYELFPGERFIRIDRPVLLKEGRATVTDVDAVILDRITGALALFQLKWQDPIASSLQKRSSKMRNFVREGEAWVNQVSTWLAMHSQEDLIRAMGSAVPRATEIASTRLFVLGRYFAHFSGQEAPRPDAAWGMWPQVVKLMNGAGESETTMVSPLEWLNASLRDDSPLLRAKPQEIRETLTLRTVTLFVETPDTS
jgi:hypothetical protein